jgi:hypothetical protein
MNERLSSGPEAQGWKDYTPSDPRSADPRDKMVSQDAEINKIIQNSNNTSIV